MKAMKTVRYLCTHCGKRFEDEEKDVLECPGCFWSTSVRREEEAAGESPVSFRPASPEDPHRRANMKILTQRFVIGLFLLLGFLAAVLMVQKISKMFSKNAVKIPAVSKPAKPVSEKNLTESEKEILKRVVSLAETLPPNGEEKKILEAHVSLKTGTSERIPSQPISIEKFKQIIAEQEKFYQVPLSKGYKKDLEKIFEASYKPAADVFAAGDLVKARDLWVQSLAFPIYHNDVERHRAVALAILRPFISDTLSKIGAINSSLVEGSVRQKEEALSQRYNDLVNLLQKGDWQEATGLINEIRHLVRGLEETSKVKEVSAPAYQVPLDQVDDTIRATLMELLSAPPPAMMDTEALLADLAAKETMTKRFIPGQLSNQGEHYAAALRLIREKKWDEALEHLEAIQFPAELVEDAHQKAEILRKLRKPS